MFVVKNLFYSFIYFILILSILTFIYTLLNYFGFFSSVIKFLIPVFSIFISSFILGNKSLKKGYVEGIKLGILVIFLFLVISFLFDKFIYYQLIYYFILLLCSCLGAMIGINRKRASS